MTNTDPKAAASANPPTLSGVIYALLRDEILRGGLSPASKLRIEELSKRYGVTGTPIREALNQLTSERFVKRLEQRGFYVADAPIGELEQLTNTRCWLEEIALREALAHRTTEWEEQLVLACHRLSRINRSANAERFLANPEWENAHRHFHRALIATCPSSWLLDFCGLLYDHAARYRNLSMSVIYPERNVADEHRELMEVAVYGDVDDAVARLIEHYRRTTRIILNSDVSPEKPPGKAADAE